MKKSRVCKRTTGVNITSPIIKKLERYYMNTPRHQVLKTWAKSEKYDFIGPSIHEFIESLSIPH